ncbi:hypothetical protein [Rhodovulum euryhalinum]|uniref:Uncharacterized protein n=1 Tax=Rhodovulum euryhalinum TaxID=35805 RepID=A0A4R2KF39_9RHOB|nr:hypothetical protein [Rhodovulum euryhalinum]TCO71664.1 hypothetical protein EV655_106157 [Rhodovulum euryhalinum]
MRKRLTGVLAAVLMLGGAALADTEGAGTYEMLFRSGTLDEVPGSEMLVYAREVTNRANPQAAEAATGVVELTFTDEDPRRAVLRFVQGDRISAIGAFPAEVGNPVVMYFMETVVRDMAGTAGGSPFYIRNRLKDSLIRPAEVEAVEAAFGAGEVQAQALTLHPFAENPNRARMMGFAELTVTVTMSDEVPGWYHTLSAEVPDPAGGAPLYVSTLRLEAEQ